MKEIDLKIDFLDDLNEQMKNELKEAGYVVDDTKEIGLQYFNTLRKTLPQIKRNVHSPKNFSVPFQYNEIIRELKKKIENGENINSYLSKQILKTNYRDKMLNHFGIYHFHLGDGIKKGFRKRSGELLFVYFDGEDAYLLGVFPHGNWLDEKILKVIVDNWPKSIEKYRIEGATCISFKAEQKEKLRKSNYTLPIEINGKVYFPFTDGVTFSGDTLDVSFRYQTCIRKCNQLEKKIKENLKEIISDEKYEEFLKINEKVNLKMFLDYDRQKVCVKYVGKILYEEDLREFWS